MMRPPFNPMGGMMGQGQSPAQGSMQMQGRAPQGQNPIGQAFGNFMGQMQGQDPNQLLDQLMSSGRVSQAQLDQAQQMAKRMSGMLDGMRGMFGF